jgi:hypothetical protein
VEYLLPYVKVGLFKRSSGVFDAYAIKCGNQPVFEMLPAFPLNGGKQG